MERDIDVYVGKEKNALKNTIPLYVAAFISGIGAYLIRLLYARILSVNEYGAFFTILSLISILSIIRDLGISESTVYFGVEKYVKKKYDILKGIFFYNQVVQTGAAIFIGYIIFLLKDFIIEKLLSGVNKGIAEIMLVIMIIFFIIQTIYRSYNTFPSVFKDFIVSGSGEALRWIFTILFSLILIAIFQKNNYYAIPPIATLLGVTFSALLYAYLFYIRYPFMRKVHTKLEKETLKKMFFYGLPLIITGLEVVLFYHIDTLIVSFFKGVQEAGYYQVAKPFMMVINISIYPAIFMLFPLIADSWHKKRINEVRMKYNLSSLLTSIISIGIGVIMVIFPKEIILLLFPSKYINAAPILSMLGIGSMFMGIFYTNMRTIMGMGMPKEKAKIFFIGALVNIILDLLLVPFLGGVGAAIATSFSIICIIIISNIVISRKIGFPRVFFKRFYRLIFSTLVVVALIEAILLMLKVAGILKLLIGIMLMGILYPIGLIVFKILEINEIKKLWKEINIF